MASLVSRRALLEAKRKLPKTPPPPKAEPSKWPDSVRYTGYALGVVVIPYTIAWLTALTPSLRSTLSEEMQDQLRSYFGTLETQPWEERNDENAKRYSLPGELNAATRAWQRQIASIQTVKVKVQQMDGVVDTQTLSASIPANQRTVQKALNLSSPVAMTFLEDEEQQQDSLLLDEQGMIDSISEEPKSHLRRTVGVYSLWHYFPIFDEKAQAAVAQPRAPSADDIEKSRLEYQIKQLEDELKSNMSTRSIDDIMQELSKAKKELRAKKRSWFF